MSSVVCHASYLLSTAYIGCPCITAVQVVKSAGDGGIAHTRSGNGVHKSVAFAGGSDEAADDDG